MGLINNFTRNIKKAYNNFEEKQKKGQEGALLYKNKAKLETIKDPLIRRGYLKASEEERRFEQAKLRGSKEIARLKEQQKIETEKLKLAQIRSKIKKNQGNDNSGW